MAWDLLTPTDDTKVQDSDEIIRQLWEDVEDILQSNGHFPISTAAPKWQYKPGRGDTASRPTAALGGLYFNTDTNELQRSNGTSWEVVGVSFSNPTKMWFYNTAAPVGWTTDTGPNARFLFIDSAAGGTTPTHSSWTVTLASAGAHRHYFAKGYKNTSYNPDWAGVRMYAAGSWDDEFALSGAFAASETTNVNRDPGAGTIRTGRAQISGTWSSGQNFGTTSNSTHTHTYHQLSGHGVVCGLIATRNS